MSGTEAAKTRKRPGLSAVLRILGGAAASLLPLPLMLLVLALLPEVHTDDVPYLLPVLIASAAGLLHLPWSAFVKMQTARAEQTRFRRIVLRSVELMIGLVLAFSGAVLLMLTRYDTGFIYPPVQFALIIVSWQIVGRSNAGAYYETYHDSHLVAFSVISLTAYVIAAIRQVTLPDNTLVFAFIYVAGIWALLRNQGNIDAQMSRGHHSFSELPSRIRRNNMLLVAGMIALLALLLIFRQPLVSLLRAFLNMLRDLAGALLRLLLSGDEPEAVPEEPAPQPGIGGGGMDALPQGESSPWWNLLYLVAGGAIIGGLIYYRSGIASALRDLLNRIKAFFIRLFNLRTSEDSDLSGSRLYDDTIVELEREGRQSRKRRRLIRRNPQRALRREAGRLSDTLRSRTEEAGDSFGLTAAEVRGTYRLMLSWLKLNGFNQVPSQTPRKILTTGNPQLGETDFAVITRIYEDVRYAAEDEKEEPLRLPADGAHQLLLFLEALRES